MRFVFYLLLFWSWINNVVNCINRIWTEEESVGFETLQSFLKPVPLVALNFKLHGANQFYNRTEHACHLRWCYL